MPLTDQSRSFNKIKKNNQLLLIGSLRFQSLDQTKNRIAHESASDQKTLTTSESGK